MDTLGLIAYSELESFSLIREKRTLIPYLFAKQREILPVEQNEKGITAAISNPLNLEALEELRFYLRAPVHPIYCAKAVLEAAIEQCYAQKEEEAKQLFSNLEKKASPTQETSEGYDLLEQADQNPIIRMVNTILLEAIQQGASDIHFEPTEEGLSVRYRIDGVLQMRHAPSRDYQSQMLTRLKVMAKMDIAEHRLPQDGRIKLRQGGKEIDFRVSTLPILHGERIVLRILDKGNVLLGLDQMGMDEPLLKSFRKLIQFPEGIILVTGPTGSGKTTTLYSALSEILDTTSNIMTIEDPVEYKLGGISQMNVNPRIDLDFAKGLRHILRQDPDVIMIGEIRDKETAEIAIQASLTGHLVFSTLHTNDAPSALTRLADMGIEPYLLASSILGVLAQRLVRSICPDCKESYTPSPEELQEIGLNTGKLCQGSELDTGKLRQGSELDTGKLRQGSELDTEKLRQGSELDTGKLCQGIGCGKCYGTGYRGRVGIYELMPVTSAIKSQVLKSQDSQELRRVATDEGMQTLFEKGVDLVLQGVTSSAELLRVTRIDQEG